MVLGKLKAILIMGALLVASLMTASVFVGDAIAEEDEGGLAFSYSSGTTLDFQSVEPNEAGVESVNTIIVTNTHETRTYQSISMTFYDIVGTLDNIILTDNLELDCYSNSVLIDTFEADGNDVALTGVEIGPGETIDVLPRIMKVGAVREGDYISTFSIQAYYETGSSLSPAFASDVFSTNIGSMAIEILGIGSFQLLYNDGSDRWDYGNQQAGAFIASTGNNLGIRNNGNQDLSEILLDFNDLAGVTTPAETIPVNGITVTQVIGNPIGGWQGQPGTNANYIMMSYAPNSTKVALMDINAHVSIYNFETGEYDPVEYDMSGLTDGSLEDLDPYSFKYMNWVTDGIIIFYAENVATSEEYVVLADVPDSGPWMETYDLWQIDGSNEIQVYDIGYQPMQEMAWAFARRTATGVSGIYYEIFSPMTTGFLQFPTNDYPLDAEFFGNSINWVAMTRDATTDTNLNIYQGNMTTIGTPIVISGVINQPSSPRPNAWQPKLTTHDGSRFDFFYFIATNGGTLVLKNGSLGSSVITTVSSSRVTGYTGNPTEKFGYYTDGSDWLCNLQQNTYPAIDEWVVYWTNRTGVVTVNSNLGIQDTNNILDADLRNPSDPYLLILTQDALFGVEVGSGSGTVTRLISAFDLYDITYDPTQPTHAYITTSMGDIVQYETNGGDVEKVYSAQSSDLSPLMPNGRITFSPNGALANYVVHYQSGQTAQTNYMRYFPSGDISNTNAQTTSYTGEFRTTVEWDDVAMIGYYIVNTGASQDQLYAIDTAGLVQVGYPKAIGKTVGYTFKDMCVFRSPTKTIGMVIEDGATDFKIRAINLVTGVTLATTSPILGDGHNIDCRNVDTRTVRSIYYTATAGITSYLYTMPYVVATDTFQLASAIGSWTGIVMKDLDVKNLIGAVTFYTTQTTPNAHVVVFGTSGHLITPNAIAFTATQLGIIPLAVQIQPVTDRIIAVGQNGLIWEVWEAGTWTSDIRSIIPSQDKFAIGKKYVDGGMNDGDLTENGEILIQYTDVGGNINDMTFNNYLKPGVTRWFTATLHNLPYDISEQVYRGDFDVSCYVENTAVWLAEQLSMQELTLGMRSLISHLYYTDGSAPLNFPASYPDAVNVYSLDAFIIDNTDSSVPITRIHGAVSDLRTTDVGSNPLQDIIRTSSNAFIVWYADWDFLLDDPIGTPLVTTPINSGATFDETFFQSNPIPAGSSVYGQMMIADINYGHITYVGPYSYSGDFTLTTVSNPTYWPVTYYGSIGTDLVVSSDTTYKVVAPGTEVEFPYDIFNDADTTLNITNDVWFSNPYFAGVAVDNETFENVTYGGRVYATLTIPVPEDTPGGQYVFTIRVATPDNASIETFASFSVFVQYENYFRGYLNQIGNSTSISYQYLDNGEEMKFLGQTFPLEAENDLAFINIHNTPLQRLTFTFSNLTNGTDVLENLMSVSTFDGLYFYGEDDGTVEVYTGEPLVGVGKIYVITGIIENIASSINGSRLYSNGFNVSVTDISMNTYDLTPSVYQYMWADIDHPNADAGENMTVSVGEEFILNGSLSTDPDGEIVKYEWDVDNDLEYEYLGLNATHHFDAVGNYSVYLRVTDDDGLTDVDDLTVFVVSGDTTPMIEISPANLTISGEPGEFEVTVEVSVTNAPATVYIAPDEDSELYGITYSFIVLDEMGEQVMAVDNATDAKEMAFYTATDADYTVIMTVEMAERGTFVGTWNFTAESGSEVGYALLNVEFKVGETVGDWTMFALAIAVILVAILVILYLYKRKYGAWPWEPRYTHMTGPEGGDEFGNYPGGGQ